MLVAPCYIIVYNAFALTGRTRKPGCSTKPRVPLRSALGYAQIALSGRWLLLYSGDTEVSDFTYQTGYLSHHLLPVEDDDALACRLAEGTAREVVDTVG